MAKEKKYLTMDGTGAAAHGAYAFTEVAGIYPITPSSPMADYTDQWSQQGRKNLFGQTVNVVEMQSEGGAAAVVHGSLNTGALTTTYTASQGLLLMIPNMYKIAGELLPAVFHVSARAIATHALSIFGDHSDVMACRQTGWAMLASSSVQEVMDLSPVAHLAAIKGRVPFINFFDGFRTSHELQKIEVLDYEDLRPLLDMDAVKAFRQRSLSPNHPTLRGSAQNPDVFFQNREAANLFYNEVPNIVKKYMDDISELTGRSYKPFNYYGAEDAEYVIVAMGSICETIQETVDYYLAQGKKVGYINVHLYRPWVKDWFLEALPKTAKVVAVLDRTKEPGSIGEPLKLDVMASMMGHHSAIVMGGRFGLGSKDTTPDDIDALFKNMMQDDRKLEFTLAIEDDVTHLSIPRSAHLNVADPSMVACRFWGLGSDGTVGANKNSIKIIGDHTDKYAQAYFSYDSKKSGGITISDLRFGDNPIHSPYLINSADFISCSQQSYADKYDMLDPIKEGGTFLLNTLWTDEQLDKKLPAKLKQKIAEKKVKFFTVNAVKIAQSVGLGNRTNTVLQAAFFSLSNILPKEEALDYMKQAIVKSYSKKGDDVISMNFQAVEAGMEAVHEVVYPDTWLHATEEVVDTRDVPEYVRLIADVQNKQEGDKIPVSLLMKHVDGTLPQGTSQYEKRGIAVTVPKWVPENCIQCNQCAYVCPHAVIRPFIATEDEAANAPEGTPFIKGAKPYDSQKFKIQISVLDCTGCGSCANVCPAKNKALEMTPIGEMMHEKERWDYLNSLPSKENPMKNNIVKGSQFNKPYLEFSGACGGCGETPYAKLITQLFGNRMQISNATGCSSIWGGSCPSTPYTTDEKGQGPTWANSLFEDNAENGLGMYLGAKQIRDRVKTQTEAFIEHLADSEALKESAQAWVQGFDDSETTQVLTESYLRDLKAYEPKTEEEKAFVDLLLDHEDYMIKRSSWIFGGDGWAYDIGFGGLDHVLATGEDVNIFVFDTEVYSNTGGQASKSTPYSAIAQFAAGGKHIKKKDLGMMAMSYGYVYVAQISMGANQAQTLKAIREAESYPGPSLIIAYAPCINHGIKGGLRIVQDVMKEAVTSGYWHLYRYDPRNVEKGKNPFMLDSKQPKGDFKEFLRREVRYSSLFKKYPEEVVEAMFDVAKEHADERWMNYYRKSKEWTLE